MLESVPTTNTLVLHLKSESKEAYKKHYNRSISIPRWHEIAHKYQKK
ncbi:NgoBV family restriction endonuclease [Neisseria meningitidis]